MGKGNIINFIRIFLLSTRLTNDLLCRCDVNQFVLSKSHKKILKTVNKFLRDGVKDKESASSVDTSDKVEQVESVVETEYLKGATRELPLVQSMEVPSGDKKAARKKADNQTKDAVDPVNVVGESSVPQGNPKKKKLLRLEKRQAKLAAKGLPVEPPVRSSSGGESSRKTLADFLSEEPKDGKHKLKV